MSDRVETLKNAIYLLKANLRKAYWGEKYVEPEKYMTEGSLDPSKYTRKMKDRFDNKCYPGDKLVRCMNADWDLCYLKCISCFQDVFNPLPDGLFSKALDYMSENGWENNTVEKIRSSKLLKDTENPF